VGVEVLVALDGGVMDSKIAFSSGDESMDASTLTEVFRWRFVPGRINGKPTEMWTIYAVTFHLPGYPMPDLGAPHAKLRKLLDQRKAELSAQAIVEQSQ